MTTPMILSLTLAAALVIGGIACGRAERKRVRAARRERFTPATEAAITEALAVADHVDDNPAAEYAIAALRRDLDAWGRG